MAQTFKISARRIDDYEIEVDVVELAELLGVPTATVTARLEEAGRTSPNAAESVLVDLLRTNGKRTNAEQFARGNDNFLDSVTGVELQQPERVTWIKTDRAVTSVIITS